MDKINYNIHVFTTKNVLVGGNQIISVIHDHDGDWQFLSNEHDLEVDDAMVVSLGEIVEHDKTLSGIIGLPLGKQAIRGQVGDRWKIYDFDSK